MSDTSIQANTGLEVDEFSENFPSESSARAYLVEIRWPCGQPICPRCNHSNCYKIRDGKLFSCKGCKKQFSVRMGTIMEDSKISLKNWLYAIYLSNITEAGISSTQLARKLKITQKSAWSMAHKIPTRIRNNGCTDEKLVLNFLRLIK